MFRKGIESMQDINELFEYLPFKLDEVGSFHGEKIYSNPKIIETSLNWISYSPITSPIKNKITEGINKGNILIGYANKNKLSFIFNKLAGTIIKQPPTVLGKYSYQENKLVIVLDNNVSVFGKMFREVPTTMAHELIHMAAHNNINIFLSLTLNSLLLPFYKNFFNNLANKTITIPDKILSKTIHDAASYFEGMTALLEIDLVKVLWSKYLSQVYNKNEVDEVMEPILNLLRYVRDLPLSSKGKSGLKQIYTSYCDSYRKIGSPTACSITTTPGQEIISMSEVVCVSNQWGLSHKIANLINSMRF